MNPEEIVANAAGDTVTSERLDQRVVRTLEDDEQPHHLLTAESLVHEDGSGSPDRLFPMMGESVSIVATNRRMLLVVPTAGGTETVKLPYHTIDSVDVETDDFPEIYLETSGKTVTGNLTGDENPEPVVGFIRQFLDSGSPDA